MSQNNLPLSTQISQSAFKSEESVLSLPLQAVQTTSSALASDLLSYLSVHTTAYVWLSPYGYALEFRNCSRPDDHADIVSLPKELCSSAPQRGQSHKSQLVHTVLSEALKNLNCPTKIHFVFVLSFVFQQRAGQAAVDAIEVTSGDNWVAGTACEVLCEFPCSFKSACFLSSPGRRTIDDVLFVFSLWQTKRME